MSLAGPRTLTLLIVALVFASAALFAGQAKEPSAVSAWIAAPAAGATSAVAYVEINNPTMYDVFVVSATAEGTASKVELRGAAAAGAEPPAVSEFPIAAYGSTSAEAGAPHLRLLGLTRALKAGDSVALALTTDSGVILKVAAAVRAQ